MQQDNSPKHSSKSATKWLKNQIIKVLTPERDWNAVVKPGESCAKVNTSVK